MDAPPRPKGNVLLVTVGLAGGGAEKQIVGIANRLAARGWKVGVLELAGTGEPNEPLDPLVERMRLKGTRFLRAWRAIGIIRRWDRCITFLFWPNLVGRLVPKRLGFRLITSFRAIEFGPRWRTVALRLSARRDDVVVANSAAARDVLLELGVCRDPQVIPNGCELPSFGSASASGRIACIANLRPEKGHARLLWAATNVPDYHFDMVGDGPLRTNLEALATQLGLQDRVTWHGFCHPAHEILGHAEAIVVPSDAEGSPNAAIEAMARGIPVIGTDVGGTRDLLREGRGILVEPTEEGLIQGIRAMQSIREPQRLTMIGRARDHVERVHRWEAVVARWEQLLQG